MSNVFDNSFGAAYRPSLMRRAGGALVVAMIAYGSASAQEGDVPPAATPSSLGGRLVAESALLSVEEKRSRSETMLDDVRQATDRATEVETEAKGTKDVVQLNCISEKLAQIRGLLKLCERASLAMLDAMQSGTEDVVNHEYTKLTVAHQRVLMLRSEADQCVGEGTIYAGETDIELELPEDYTEEDPTETAPPPVAPEVPPIASPF